MYVNDHVGLLTRHLVIDIFEQAFIIPGQYNMHKRIDKQYCYPCS